MVGQIGIQAQGSRLDKAVTGRFDADGRAEVTLGPVPAGAVWRVTRMTISAEVADPMPACRVYEGLESPEYLLDATYTGAQNASDFTGDGHPLEDGQQLLFVWEGGTPLTSATARIVGRIEPA